MVSATVNEASKVLRPEVAVAVVQTVGFPIGLALAVLVFLVVQNHLDRRDPKLREAPLTEAETLLPFEREEEP